MSTPHHANGPDIQDTDSVSTQRHVAEKHKPRLDNEGTTSEKSTTPHDQEARGRLADNKVNKVADVSDTENGSLSPDHLGEEDRRTHSPTFYARYRVYVHLVIWLFFTGLVLQARGC